jgi:hypothetical protein
VALARVRVWVIFCTLALLIGGLYGQQDFRGSIEGRVLDPTGGVIPGVTVTATLLEQDKTHTTLSNDSGAYNFSYLEPGAYRLKAVMPGFKTYERSEIVVQVNDKLTIDITLTVGNVSQEIVVRGDTTPLTQAIPNFDQSVEEKQVEDLPLNGRNTYLLFGLAAGVLPEGDPSRLRPFDNDATSELTVGGTGNRTSEISLDGGTNLSGGGRVVFIPSTEAVKEFKVTTSAFDASVGNTTGAIINASMKSGTEKFRGSIYEYHRNSALDANFWNANRQGIPLPSAKWNQFGASLGGPLRIPFRPHGKAHTFFFINYEGMRQNRIDSPFIRTVPTELERRGDFSQTMYFDERSGEFKPVTIYDPLSTRCIRNCNRPPDPARPGRTLAPVFQRDAFRGNVIPATRFNSVAARLLDLIPLPNRPGDPTTRRDNFIQNGADINIYDQFIARIDHNISERQNMFVSLSFSNLDNTLKNWLGNVASPNQGIGNRTTRRFVIDDTYSFDSGLVLNTQYALARYVNYFRQASIGVDLASVGFSSDYINKIKQSFIAKEGTTAFPDIDINNYIRLGVAGDNVKSNIANDAHELRTNFTKMMGKHGLRWGFDGRVIRRNEYNFGLPVGRLSFGKSFTHGPNPSAAQRVDAGNEFATFLLGYPTGGFIEQKTTFAIQDLYTGAFIQDDFKISRRLTINAGLRWEYWWPRTERYDRITRGFAYDKENPIAAAVHSNIQAILANPDYRLASDVAEVLSQLDIKGGLLYAGRDGAPRGQLNSRPYLFAPRLGFAYRVSDKMVLRGGAGIYYEPLTRVGNPPQDGFNARTNYVATITTDQTGPRPASSLTNPFPGDLLQPYGASRGLLTHIGQDISFTNPDRTAPRVLRVEFGIQREVPGRIGINANYLTTRWRGRPTDAINLNEIPDSYLAYGGDFLSQSVPNPFYDIPEVPRNTDIGRSSTITVERLLRLYPQFNNVTTSFNRGYGWYNGFNLNVSRRFERGFLFQAAYTVAKGMTATTYANPDDRKINKLDRRLVDDDRPQRLVLNGIWELPFGGNKRFFTEGWPSKVLGGWQVSGISIFMAGRPVHFGDNRNYAVNLGKSAHLPNGPFYDAKLRRWVLFDRSAFRVRRTNELRNVPRNLPDVRVPGINTIDLRITRNFPINERVRMQFIAETFNLTNRVQLGAPNTDIRNVNFGTTINQANLPRSYQFGLRLQF